MGILSALRDGYHDENNTDDEDAIHAEFERRDNEEAQSPSAIRASKGDLGSGENAGQKEVQAGPDPG
jgi:hypothetical protein